MFDSETQLGRGSEPRGAPLGAVAPGAWSMLLALDSEVAGQYGVGEALLQEPVAPVAVVGRGSRRPSPVLREGARQTPPREGVGRPLLVQGVLPPDRRFYQIGVRRRSGTRPPLPGEHPEGVVRGLLAAEDASRFRPVRARARRGRPSEGFYFGSERVGGGAALSRPREGGGDGVHRPGGGPGTDETGAEFLPEGVGGGNAPRRVVSQLSRLAGQHVPRGARASLLGRYLRAVDSICPHLPAQLKLNSNLLATRMHRFHFSV